MTRDPHMAGQALSASSPADGDARDPALLDPTSTESVGPIKHAAPQPGPSAADVGDVGRQPPAPPPAVMPPAVMPPVDHGRPLEPMRGNFGHLQQQTPGVTIIPPKSAAPDWGPTSLGISATAAAGVSYLGWWLTGLLIYFNERRNWYVRFHALQSVLYTGALTIITVLGFVASSLLTDLYLATHQLALLTISRWLVVVIVLAVVGAWLTPVIAAWCGYRLRIPFFAPYAERYAPPFDSEPAARPDATDEGESGSDDMAE